jgi:putative hemolysin
MPRHPALTTPFSMHPGRHSEGLLSRVAALTAPVMDPLLGLTTLDRLYAGLPEGNFIDRALERLGIAVDVSDEHLRSVPATGPAIVVANHPTGALDGLALAHALMRRRGDVRLLGNHLLSRVPEMRDWTIAVNPFDPRSIANRRGLRQARDWLMRGGLLVVFPAGAVSNVAREDGVLVDSEWQRGVLGLTRWSSAQVVPAFVGVRSSGWFRLAGLIHPRLRTALLPRELLRLRNGRVNLRFGAAVPAARLAAIADAQERLAYLRARTDALEAAPRSPAANWQPIVAAVDVAALRRDVAALPPQLELLRSGTYSVFCAPAAMLPALLQEIGRLREVTFRAVGEGTGRSIDLDHFDGEYQHLFVWHHSRSEVVGAYRIGATDRVCDGAGVKALYTHTLFKLAPGFLEAAGPSLELGRSFVRAEYQRESNALSLLWKGIGALVARQPRYRRLFGPVSISADYSRPSRGVLARFLNTTGGDPSWQRLVSPRHPLRTDALLDRLISRQPLALSDVDALVKELEGGRGVPVLVRQYWKLGARVLGVSLDPAFGNSLDGLMMVDLARLPGPILQRYLGQDGAAAFRRHHGLG